jgi:purine nucleoside permease
MIPINFLLLAAFEPDSSLVPGELRYFIEREHLTQTLPLPAAYRSLRFNPERGILACITGVGAARAAASVMALGLDPRFDLTNAYILITGVAGIDPFRGSLASVVLPEFVIDGNIAHEIDAREIPPDWPDGFVPIGKSTPYEQPLAPRFNGDDGILYRLNAELTTHALNITSDLELLDTPAIARRRQCFSPPETAHEPPTILAGDEISSSTFWHGSLLSARARAWVDYQSKGAASYVITVMEDSGILQSLQFLARANRVDWKKILIVRAAANYDQQRDNLTASESLAETRVATDSAYLPALENAWRVGHCLIESLLK